MKMITSHGITSVGFLMSGAISLWAQNPPPRLVEVSPGGTSNITYQQHNTFFVVEVTPRNPNVDLTNNRVATQQGAGVK